MSPSMSHVRTKQGAALLLVPFLLMLGCKDAAKETPAPQAQAEDPAAVHPEIWPSPKWPLAKDDALEEKIAALKLDADKLGTVALAYAILEGAKQLQFIGRQLERIADVYAWQAIDLKGNARKPEPDQS